MKKILFFMLVFMFCISINPIFSKEEKYPEHVCKEIYGAIGLFLKLADDEWKKTKNEEKALFYSQAAANYSTVYETVCRYDASQREKS